MQDVYKTLLFCAAGFAYLFVMSKMLGKKQIAQLDVIDYMLGITVSSIAAEMAVNSADAPIYIYIAAMSFFFLLNLIIVFLERKGKLLKKLIKGNPLMVIYEGKINYKALKKSKMDINDLISQSREKGYFDLNDIAYAVFENSGKLSIMPKSDKRPVVAKDFDIKISAAKLPFYLVDDGIVSFSALRTLNKSEEWLYKRLNIQDKKELKSIILASYNEESDEIIISSKN